ncbi:ataxin-7 isoform X1 [Pygocentrus nattereri]|uniref:SCA7 domain-containing protein n=2 Tax=Pygocentrus nattereri TaxID=42514 RepID=A0A3B4CBD9_PYGNA|nr:ataxin-7 isoform X1 [Pygocentrus nattereri]
MLRGKQTWTHLVETSTVTEHRVRSPFFYFSSRAPSSSPARPEASVLLRFRSPFSPRSRRTERSCVQRVWPNGIAKADEDLLICTAEFQFSLLTSAGVCVCFCVPAGSMSDRADEEVRGERSRAARQQLQQQQLQRGEAATAMAPASLPSPQITPGQSWSSWADAVKLHGGDGADSEESFKECGKNREAMRLCREDMPIFGQCPAQDDFYLVMCSHCTQVVKPQAFQAHYERRHSSLCKPPSAYPSAAAYPVSGLSSRNRSGGGSGTAGSVAASSSGSNSTPSAKEKMPHRKPHFPLKGPPDDNLTPAVKVEKIHLKMDYSSSSKLSHMPTSSSSSASTVSSSPSKPGLNSPSVPKAQLLASGHIPNGKGHLTSLDKKQDSSTNASSRRLYRKQPEREFNPDIHCGVLDIGACKPCTRSLTCKTHSLSQRRAVPGRRKRFDTLLAEHKNRAREKELQHRSEPSQQTPSLRDPHPPLSRLPQDSHHPPPHGNGTAADASKPFTLSKPKPHNPGLPRLNSSSSHSGVSSLGDPALVHDSTQHPHSAPTPDGVSRLSSDEGENEEREEGVDKLDCHYSGYHPRPAAFCTFGSRLFGRSCYSFDRRWDRVRCALAVMMDKHVNSLMWKKIPLAPENSSSSAVASSHRSSTNSLSSSSGFLSPSPPPPYGQLYDNKPTLSYGTTLNARAAPQRAGEQLAYSGGSSSGSSRQVSSSSPQMPSAHSSSLPSTPGSSRPPKSRSGAKSFRVRDSSSSATLASSVSNSGGSSNSGSSSSMSTSSSAGAKKRKNSSLLTSHGTYAAESSSSSSSSSSSFKKNCAVNSGTSGSSFHSSLTSTPSSAASSSSSSSHSAGVNCLPGRVNSLSLRQEAASRGPPPASPAEPIKRMSVVMNSSDSTLSLGPFVHQSSEHHGHADARIDTKRRKSSPASSGLAGTGTSTASAGGGGSQVPGRPKMPKSSAVNNIHSKHARPMPGTPGLPNNSLIHQPKARP